MASNKHQNRATIVPASAGSGKTYRLAHEYIYDTLRNRYDDNGRAYFDHTIYKRILAVTFTNKATEEMKSRILAEIHTLASGEESDHLADLIKETSLSEEELRSRAKIVRSAILHDYSHFAVLTNDTFFQRILRAFVRELGFDLNFTTELDTAPLVIRGVDAVIEDITTDETLRQWLEDLVAERIDDGERWNIREPILLLHNAIFNEATHDIIANLSDKESLNKKISDFRLRIERQASKVKNRAQQAIDYIVLQGYSHAKFSSSWTSCLDKIASGDIKLPTKTFINHLSDDPASWFRKKEVTPALLVMAAYLQPEFVALYHDILEYNTLKNTLTYLLQNYRYLALLYDLQKKVKEFCGKDNSMLISETRHTIARFISEAETPFIYEKVGNYFDKFMIDEFQDTSAKEWYNFLPLLRNAMAQSNESSVLIVGDVKQSIYRWRGGDWKILGSQVAADLKDVATVPLENNWRSLPNIVNFNNTLFEKLIENDNKILNDLLNGAKSESRITERQHSMLYNMLQEAYFSHSQRPMRKHINKGFISVDVYDRNDKKGAALYIERIREVLAMGYKPCDITILVRNNSDAIKIADDLLASRATFPEEHQFEITTEDALNIASSPAAQLIMALLRLAINRKDTASLAIYNKMHNDSRFDTKLTDEENAFLDQIRTMPLEDAFENILIRYASDFEGAAAYVQAMHEHIVRFSTGKVSDIALFDKWWNEKSEKLSVRVDRSERAIEIITIHKAKGLENKVVLIPLCNWAINPRLSNGRSTNIVWAEPRHDDPLSNIGIFPLRFVENVKNSLFSDGYYSEFVYSHIDNINMLYVALTRAKEHLYIFIPTGGIRNIGTLLLESLPDCLTQVKPAEEEIKEGENEGENETPPIVRYTMGEPHTPEPIKQEDKGPEMVWQTDYKASPVTIKMRTSASRYFDSEDKGLTPRSIGIKLHRLFEGASSREDIFAKLNLMATNGDISASEVIELEQHIRHALDNTVAGEWFDGSWDNILHERNIIRPNKNHKRPDRIMLRGKSVVVVDYKFGAEKDNHHSQIESYKAELRAMGYTDIRGFIWYVTNEKVVEVE